VRGEKQLILAVRRVKESQVHGCFRWLIGRGGVEEHRDCSTTWLFPRNESAFSAIVGLVVWNLLAGGDFGHRGRGAQWPLLLYLAVLSLYAVILSRRLSRKNASRWQFKQVKCSELQTTDHSLGILPLLLQETTIPTRQPTTALEMTYHNRPGIQDPQHPVSNSPFQSSFSSGYFSVLHKVHTPPPRLPSAHTLGVLQLTYVLPQRNWPSRQLGVTRRL
jgi:hypothetical protein